MGPPDVLTLILMVIFTIVLLLSIVLLVVCLLRYKKVCKQLRQNVNSSHVVADKKLPEQIKSAKENKEIISTQKTRSTSKKEKRDPVQKSLQKTRQNVSESLDLDHTQRDDTSVKKSRTRGKLKLKPNNFTKVFVCRGSDGEWRADGEADHTSEFSFVIMSGDSGEDTFPASILEQA